LLSCYLDVLLPTSVLNYPFLLTFFCRTTKSSLLFLPYLKVGRLRNEPLLPMILKALLALRVKSRDLTNPRLPLIKKQNRKLPNLHTDLLPLLLQRTKGREVKLKIPAPPNPAGHLPRKLPPRRRVPSILTRMPSLARKLSCLLFLFICCL
jgi:hypothetical protein